MKPYQFPCDHNYPLCSSCGLGASYHGICGNSYLRVKHPYRRTPYTIDRFSSIPRPLPKPLKSKSRSKPKSKPRQHEGIVQRGPKKGSLKKGYKYTGERTPNGLAVIVKT